MNNKMKNKMKKATGFLISTVMVFSLFLAVPQGVRAEENQDPTEFTDATPIGNGEWMEPDSNKLYNVYFNDEPYFKAATDESPERGPANIMLNQAYKTRMDNTVGGSGTVYDPGAFAYYYFTLTNPANVTIYGQCSTASNSFLAIQKMDSVDDSFAPTTISLGMVTSDDEVKTMSACLTAGSYLVSLGWGQGRPTQAGACYSYVKVNADYNINQETDSQWNETFPNDYDGENHEYICTPYQIGKVMNGVTGIGTSENTTKYYAGYYSFTISEKTQFHLSDLNNVSGARIITKDGEEFYITNTDYAAILEPGDYVLEVYAKTGSKTYSFNSYTSAVPAIAGVDTMAEKGWSVSGETVTINNLNVNSGDYAEFCIWSGDKENAGYGKGTAKLVIKGNCFIKTLVIDCPVEVTCESGAQLGVGELVVNTTDGADGKLTYAGGTTYNAATKTFEVVCAHTKMITVGKKAATCTEPGYTGDQVCDDCGMKVLGQKINALGHKWDAGTVTKKATESEEGIKTFKCTNPGCTKTKTESVEKLPKKEPVKGDKIKDENTGATCKVLDDKKNEVSYVAPASKNASKLSVPKTIKIDGKIYKVVSIDAKAFKNNKNLKTLTLPATVVKIGANTFAGCKKLKTIKITSKKLTSKTVAKNAFKGLSKTTTIKVPKKQLKAYKKLLKKKGFKGKVK